VGGKGIILLPNFGEGIIILPTFGGRNYFTTHLWGRNYGILLPTFGEGIIVLPTFELGPDERVGKATGLREPHLLLDVRVEIAVRTVLDLLHLVLADLDEGLGDAGEPAGGRVEDDAVVEDPLAVGQHRLRAPVLLTPDVALHRLQVHRASDVVLTIKEP
jgi:hypothetical protein